MLCALFLAMSGTSFLHLQIHCENLLCPPQQGQWSFRIAWAEPKVTPLPGLVLRNHVADHDLLLVCSSSQCLMSISEDKQSEPAKETI
jgi:hypothetical protein